MIFHLQIKRSLRKNYEMYLVHVMEWDDGNNKSKANNKDAESFLSEINDMFPNELKDLSPVREVDYAIELVVDAIPATKAP